MLDIESTFHTGLIVEDIHAAVTEYEKTFATRWTDIEERHLTVRTAEGPQDIVMSLCYSRVGPHRLELIQALPGTLWAMPANPYLGPVSSHHLGVWSDDVATDSRELEENGCPLVVTLHTEKSGAAYFAYHRMPNGVLVELVDTIARAGFERWWAGAPFPEPVGY
ncbi:MAG: hypothetical protein JWM76_503 [Pseudonocardiales bacterium]|nr:hypothetical protein [Pseudonocardiales bacterium]